MAGRSLDSVWIPTIVVTHLLGIAMALYAIQALSGALTGLLLYMRWRCGCCLPKKSVERELADASLPGGVFPNGTVANGYPPQGVEMTREMQEDLEAGVVEIAPGHKVLHPVPVELTFWDVSYEIHPTSKQTPGAKPRSKTVIHPCSGKLATRTAVAVMGPSGAGKSSMMDILCGRKAKGKGLRGRVEMNGYAITPAITSKYLSYIKQEDAFLPNLTAWESLGFYTWLSLPIKLTKENRHNRMEAVMETMGLRKVKNTMVGGALPGGVVVRGLSGGEKRRLSVACGLVGNPSLMFLDEPTSGLDSHAALAMVKHLIALTRLGHTIACSIHQPRQEIFNAFDKVMILSEGHLVYYSSPKRCCQWFNGELGYEYYPEEDGTVADWIISLVNIRFQEHDAKQPTRFMTTMDEIERASKAFAAHAEKEKDQLDRGSLLGTVTGMEQDHVDGSTRNAVHSLVHSFHNLLASTEKKDVIAEAASRLAGPSSGDDEVIHRKGQYSQGWLIQYLLLTQRALWTTLRNPSESATRLLVGCYLGMFAGLVYIRIDNNALSIGPRLSTIFFMVLLNALTPISYMAFYVADRRFFQMDSDNGLYAPSAYYMAAVSAGSPFIVLNTCISSLMVYGLAGLRDDTASIFIFMAIMSLHSLVSNQLLVTCIWLTPTQDTAYAIASTYLTFSLLFCGFYIPPNNIKLSVARALTWASYSKYTFQALALNELDGMTFPQGEPDCVYNPYTTQPLPNGFQPNCTTTVEFVLQALTINIEIVISSVALLAFYVFFHCTSYLALLKLWRSKGD